MRKEGPVPVGSHAVGGGLVEEEEEETGGSGRLVSVSVQVPRLVTCDLRLHLGEFGSDKFPAKHQKWRRGKENTNVR